MHMPGSFYFVELDIREPGCYYISMETFSSAEIDNKILELVETIDDIELRKIILRRLKRNTHLVVGAILVDEKKRICLVQEAKGPWAGKWNTPIGHLSRGETIPDGAKREVKEETGYDIELISLLPLQNVRDSADNRTAFRVLYVGKIIGGSPEERNKSDTLGVKWSTISEIEQMERNHELRDTSVLSDVQLYQRGQELPLDIIEEVEYTNQ